MPKILMWLLAATVAGSAMAQSDPRPLDAAEELEIMRAAVARHMSAAQPYLRSTNVIKPLKTQPLCISTAKPARAKTSSEQFDDALEDAVQRNHTALELAKSSPWPADTGLDSGSEPEGEQATFAISRPGRDESGKFAVLIIGFKGREQAQSRFLYRLRKDGTWKVVEMQTLEAPC